MNLYRGFIPLSGKKATMSFKDKETSDLPTLEEVRKFNGYAGILEMINFQKKLIELRDKANLSIQALSEISGVPKSTIFNYEKKRGCPNFGQGRQPVKSVRGDHSNRKRGAQQ